MIRGLFLSLAFSVGALASPAVHAAASPTAPTGPPSAIAPVPLNSSSCYWRNCTEAHQNGEGNISQNNPHYCGKQDRDGDGIACEW